MSRSTAVPRTDKLIDGLAVAKLAGRTDPYFAHTQQRRSPTFPKALVGGVGKGKSLWSKAAVEAWLTTWKKQEECRQTPTRLRERTTSTLDNAMARQFICQAWGLASLSIAQKYKY